MPSPCVYSNFLPYILVMLKSIPGIGDLLRLFDNQQSMRQRSRSDFGSAADGGLWDRNDDFDGGVKRNRATYGFDEHRYRGGSCNDDYQPEW